MKEDKELEEAKKYIRIILRQKDLPDAAKSLGYVYAVDAIETVLQTNEKLKQELQNSIPKKKIEDKIEKLKEKYNNSVNDIYKKPTEALIDFQRIVGAIEVLQDLLKDK